MNKVSRGSGPAKVPEAAALYYFPEVFGKPRDEYIAAYLHDMANDLQEDGQGFSTINAYLGNLQIKPVSRLWNTYKLGGDYSHKAQPKPKSLLHKH